MRSEQDHRSSPLDLDAASDQARCSSQSGPARTEAASPSNCVEGERRPRSSASCSACPSASCDNGGCACSGRRAPRGGLDHLGVAATRLINISNLCDGLLADRRPRQHQGQRPRRQEQRDHDRRAVLERRRERVPSRWEKNTVPTTATPSAPPSCWAVLNMPPAPPATSGHRREDDVHQRDDHQRQPAPASTRPGTTGHGSGRADVARAGTTPTTPSAISTPPAARISRP